MLSSQITKDPECPICFYLNWCSITKDACLKNFQNSMNSFQVQILKKFCKKFSHHVHKVFKGHLFIFRISRENNANSFTEWICLNKKMWRSYLLGIMFVVLMYRVLTCKLGNSRNISIICTFSVQGVRWPVMSIPPTLTIKGSNFSYNLKVCPSRFMCVMYELSNFRGMNKGKQSSLCWSIK